MAYLCSYNINLFHSLLLPRLQGYNKVWHRYFTGVKSVPFGSFLTSIKLQQAAISWTVCFCSTPHLYKLYSIGKAAVAVLNCRKNQAFCSQQNQFGIIANQTKPLIWKAYSLLQYCSFTQTPAIACNSTDVNLDGTTSNADFELFRPNLQRLDVFQVR